MKISVDYSNYIHQYEAVRISKESDVLKGQNTDAIKEEDGSVLVLTDEAKKQLIQDRLNYSVSMMQEGRRISEEQNQEALEKYLSDQATIMAVFRSMASGKMVSDTDEKKLMEYDSNMYQAAKMAQMMARRAEQERVSHFDENADKEHEKKMQAYNDKIEEFNAGWNERFDGFLSAQKGAIVEIGSVSNNSSIKSVVNLGGGIAGANVDFSI